MRLNKLEKELPSFGLLLKRNSSLNSVSKDYKKKSVVISMPSVFLRSKIMQHRNNNTVFLVYSSEYPAPPDLAEERSVGIITHPDEQGFPYDMVFRNKAPVP
ncbi:hypothetical protein SAMN06265348_11653 [Pedobacter westerhofensis]|uniref:Uncharacterized protein n=1 Tax=Pedobacter westerhofensis TaxID=425512 RepID=A0A521FS52_9SPHI|nr:hypothetical protein SAMN06265348_11653 [Pedobacter westerhofensis]